MAKRPSKYSNSITYTHTLLVDGNALFKLGYHGAKDQVNRNGKHIGGLYQFITIIRKLLMDDLYHRVFVFWDGRFSGRMRYKLYKDYKADRGKNYEDGTEPTDLQERLEKFMITQYLEELCIRQIVDDTYAGIEADDYIAEYCNTKSDEERITICTGDTDLCQLIDTNIRIYLCNKKVYVDDTNYQNFFKHHQTNSKLIKIIGGDSSDSIRGIKGVKETTLLNYFPELKERPVTLEEILASAKAQQDERIKTKKKPLKALDNIINKVTDGIQGERIYEINEALVDLSKPLIDDNNRTLLEELKWPLGDLDNRGIKNVYTYMKRDGIDKLIYNFSTDYLMPFKELIERERKALK